MARIYEEKWTADFLVSEAELYRSRDVIIVPQGNARLLSGTLLGANNAPAAAPGDVVKILWAAVNPTEGPVRAVAVTRDAEVNDAYLLYGSMPRPPVNEALAARNIIVREGVLAEAIAVGTAVEPSAAQVVQDSSTPPEEAATEEAR